jgi:predicted flap endonuclease-1-like 5' DNA nuclease
LILRLVLAVLLTGVVVTLVALLHNLRPDVLRPIYAVLVERTAFSFVVGVLVNLVLAILTAPLLLCLVGLLPGVLLLGVNLVGWAVVSQYVGQRLTGHVQTSMRPVASATMAALLLTGLVTMPWALGGWFFTPLAFLLWLLLSSPGVGAAVVHWLKLDGRVAPSPLSPAEAQTRSSAVPPPPPPASPPTPDTGTASVTPVGSVVYETPSPEPPPSITPAEPATHLPVASAEPSVDEVDFTLIRGIGPTFDRRLKSAGIHTFAQLGALSADQIADMIGWTPQRVLNDDLIGQAQRLSEAKQ